MNFTTIDVGAAYRDTRNRLLEIASGLTDDQWEQVVPHCPEWTVRQTFAHLAGVADDAINGRMDGVATEPWTAAQVAKRAEVSGPDIAAEWATTGPFIDAVATQRGLALAQLLFDTVTHEHDIRYAVDIPGARDSDGVKVGLAFIGRSVRSRAKAIGVALDVEIDGASAFADTEAAAGQPGADASSGETLRPLILRASMFDTVRTFGSRRSLEQIAALDWSGEPLPVISELVPFGTPAQSFEE